MKRNTISKSTKTLLILGLMLTSLTPIISRYYPTSDLFKGMITGLGIALEVVAIIRLQRTRKDRICTAATTQDS